MDSELVAIIAIFSLVAAFIVVMLFVAMDADEQEVTQMPNNCYNIVEHYNHIFSPDHTVAGIYCKVR